MSKLEKIVSRGNKINTEKKGVITQDGMTFVVNDEIITRMNAIIKKDNKEVSMEWLLVEVKPPYKATDIWYITDTKTNKKEEILCSELLDLYPVLKTDEITQEEYFRKLEEGRTMLDKYQMTNKYMNEQMPYIEESLYHEMDAEDKKTYDELPEKVTIYRGTSAMEFDAVSVSQSWTLDKNIANFFAWHHYEHLLSKKNLKNRVVLRARISKEDIYAYTSERSESECIVNENMLDNVKIYQKYSVKNAKQYLRHNQD